MATRVYTHSTGPPAVTPSDWEFPNQINPVSLSGSLTKNTGATMTSKTENTDTSNLTHFRAMGRTILGPLNAVTISGSVTGQMRGAENNAGANASLAIAIKLIRSDTLADRGILLAPVASDATGAGNELVVNTLTNTPFKTVAESTTLTLTSQTAQSGDFLVIEWGFRCVTGTQRTVTLSYGNDSANDLTAGGTTQTAADNPWWEFTTNFTLKPPVLFTASVQGSSTTPAVLAQQERRLTANAQGSSTTPAARAIIPQPWVNGRATFTNATIVIVESPGTSNLLVQAYDAGTPATQLGAAISVHPTTGVTTVIFAQSQSGYLVGGTTVVPGYGQTFSGVMSVTVDGDDHGFATPNLLVQVYDALGTALAARVQVSQSPPYDVTVTFLQAQSGRVVVGSALPGGVTPNGATTFTTSGTPPSVTLLASTHGRAVPTLLVQTRDSAGQQVLGDVQVDPTTADVTVTFLQPVTGTLLLGGGTPAGVRALTASLLGASTTPASLVTTLRPLLASLSGVSTTPASASTQTRSLTATLLGTSTTPASTTTQARLLTSVLSGVSTTPPSLVTQTRPLTATVAGTSTTSASDMLVVRTLTATLSASSLTSQADIILSGLRALTASLSGSTTTPGALVTHDRLFQGAVLGVSLTPASLVTTVRPLTSTLAGVSATSASDQNSTRLLLASLVGASVTAAADAVLTSGRLLTASLLGTSTTPAALVTQQRLLTASLAGSSMTPSVLVTTVRLVAGTLTGTSVTSPSASALDRRLVASLQGSSTTSQAGIVVSGLRELSASLVASSTTPASGVTLARRLVSTLLGASTTPPALSAIQRPLTALLAGSSTTPPGTLVNTALLTSALQGSTTTPGVVVTLARTLRAQVQGLSTTPPSLVQQLRLLEGGLIGSSLTPAALGHLIRQLQAAMAGASITSVSMIDLARSLAAALAGLTQTPASVVTTERPLEATLAGVSSTPIVLLIPNSGEMACRASLSGSSTTTAATMVYLPMDRITVIGPRERIGYPVGMGRMAKVA